MRDAVCIFCGGGPLTLEDIRPKWMHPTLVALVARLKAAPHSPTARLVGVNRTVDNTHPEGPIDLHRWNADLPVIAARIVCEPCNNLWMSDIEGGAKNDLIELIEGRNPNLSISKAHAIARWLALKGVCMLHVHSGSPASDEWRRALYTGRDIPIHWRARIGRTTSEDHLYFSSAMVDFTVKHPLSPFPLTYPGFIGTVAVGRFVGQVIGTQGGIVNIPINRDYFLPIWPPPEINVGVVMRTDDNLRGWPPKRTITAAQLLKALPDPREPRK